MSVDWSEVSISAVLPAFNESAVIEDVVRRTHRALAGVGLERFEVIVVDDGSSDGTGAAVERLGAELAGVRTLRHPANRGYGAALRTGFENAEGELIWLLDSDGQFDPADLGLLLAPGRTDAYVIGYRARRQDSAARRAYHAAFFGLVRLSLGPTVRDVNCAFRLFPRRLGLGLTMDGALISTEMMLRARKLAVPIVEIPVPHHPRTAGRATGARPAVVLRAFGELARLRRAQAAPTPEPAPAPSDAGSA